MNSFSKSSNTMWGLFQKDSEIQIPLKSLDISISIIHNIAKVNYTQLYRNNSSNFIETEFFFPISPDACFDSFQAKFKDTTIKGIVKEKSKAKQDYTEAISSGKTAAYSEINEETGDLMKALIGNIPPNTDVSVTYSYIQKLETALNKFWCFRLFSTFAPRYNGDLNEYLKRDISLLASYPTISPTDSRSYPWSIKVEVQSPSPIKFLRSPSHKIVTEYGNEHHTCSLTLDAFSNYTPNKDFVLLYSNDRENRVDYLMTPFEGDYCAMVTLFADFEEVTPDEAYLDSIIAKKPSNSFAMNTIRGEYIFLIDRSGSMSESRIDMAKSSLILFLKSLPKDSCYNVVSFGSDYSFLHYSRKSYSEQSLNSSIHSIENFKADMGGTQIYQALKAVFDSAPKEGYPRFVFLLTDGDISNTQQVLDLVSANSDKARVFTIGIGNGCSPELITKAAYYGRGKHEFVQNSKDIHTKVISLLEASLSPSYSDISLEADNFDGIVKSVTPNPASIPFLLNGQPITFFLFIREAAFQDTQKMPLKLRLYDSRVQKHRTVEIVLDRSESMKNSLIPKLAIHDMIKRLEQQKSGVNNKNCVQWNDKKDISSSLLELSVKYGILCKETAFFCEIAQNNTGIKTLKLMPTKVLIPTISSCDSHSFSPVKLRSYTRNPKPNDLKMDQRVRRPIQERECLITSGNTTKYCPKSQNYDPSLDALQQYLNSSEQLCRRSSWYSVPLKNDLHFDMDASKYSNQFPASKSIIEKDTSNYTRSILRETTFKYHSEMNQEKNSTDRNVTSFYKANDCFEFIIPIQTEKGKNSRQLSTGSSFPYMCVIMSQNFEGFWSPLDEVNKSVVLKYGYLPPIPDQIKAAYLEMEKVWMTILVLFWLEVVWQSEKQAWRLIHKKGCEWLQSVGVDYEKVKELGRSVIKI